MFSLFTDIETFHWPVISHYAGIYKALTAFFLMLLQHRVMLVLFVHLLLFVGK